MHFRMIQDAQGIRFEGSIREHELVNLDLSPVDRLAIRQLNASVGGPTFNEDALRVLAGVYRRYREKSRK